MSETKYCSVSKKCSGCQLSNMDYDRQLRFKQNEIRIHFNRLCKIDKIIGAKSAVGYRNKALFLFKRIQGQVKCGIYQSATKTIVLTDTCALHTKMQNDAAVIICKLFDKFKIEPYDFFHHRGIVKSVIIRESAHTGELMVVIVCDQKRNFPSSAVFAQELSKKLPNLASLILTKHKGTTLNAGETPKVIFGKETITDRLLGLDFIISYNSFFQINPAQTEVLYNTAVEMAQLSENDIVLDAYSGTGTIGMICAPHCKKVYSVEVVENAVKDAKKNAKLNHIDNIEAVCADSQDYMKVLTESKTPVTCAVLDPPRAGCSKSFLYSLSELAPRKIVYISCNIETQLRDVRLLLKNGYSIDRVQGVDMFPYTKHIECVIRLSRITQ
ncbi:MAG: 23S rRNA (uracil(1939)-C(5))-methyltransferase RlmD [Ruminococcus sp.]|nr:23S rRNA (uracil(1939)-C(5))-methyltransferase RlmD [Ruminococcus sp.]